MNTFVRTRFFWDTLYNVTSYVKTRRLWAVPQIDAGEKHCGDDFVEIIWRCFINLQSQKCQEHPVNVASEHWTLNIAFLGMFSQVVYSRQL